MGISPEYRRGTEAFLRGNKHMARTKTKLVQQYWAFLKVRKKYWLAPIAISLILLGLLLVTAQGSAIAPFIYTLF
jgi:hypothetical protein